MAVFMPDVVERICASGRRLSRERFLVRVSRLQAEDIEAWWLLECIERFFVEERWELMEVLMDRAEELFRIGKKRCNIDDQLDEMRVKMLWCRGDHEAALSLAREKATPDLLKLLDSIEAAGSGDELAEEWRKRADNRPEPDSGRLSVSLDLYGVALNPVRTAVAMGVEDWRGRFTGMFPSFPRRVSAKMKIGRWTVRSALEDTASAASQTQDLLEYLGWPFPPPMRWPLRLTEIEDVEHVQLDVYAADLTHDGSLAKVDARFESRQLAALGELGVDLILSRYPE